MTFQNSNFQPFNLLNIYNLEIYFVSLFILFNKINNDTKLSEIPALATQLSSL